jgi:hypothetical protein
MQPRLDASAQALQDVTCGVGGLLLSRGEQWYHGSTHVVGGQIAKSFWIFRYATEGNVLVGSKVQLCTTKGFRR